MSKYTREDVIRIVREKNVHFIRLQFTDIFGQLKNVTLPSSQIEKAVDGEIMFDGSSIEGYTRIEESDQYLRPDLDTFVVIPWDQEAGVSARMICDVYNPDGTPFAGDPRGVLHRVLREAADMGYTFNVGPECEFFLFKTDADGKPTTRTNDEVGYFDQGPLDTANLTRERICLVLEEMGFEIEASHHECAAGQHEIDFKYADALTAADDIMTFKLAVKTLAQKDGLHATFMPKPLFGVAGNGMHINMSLFRDGKNAFYDEAGARGLSPVAYQFIAGVLAHVPAICALTNPLVNSYKRLVPGYEAPCYISWSTGNRSALIRVPAPRGSGTRLELRNPDPSCNPYLALAVCLAAGLDGIKRGMTPPPEVTDNIYELSAAERKAKGIGSLPDSLKAATDALRDDELICGVLGTHALLQYLIGKEEEWNAYCTRVSSWEVERYITNY
ncbi:MAG: type I glutamate--ammonia ligase [Ruminococcaceae bacterium]|nr:type I glutamate--ammonia ligase [Oscillospiraceae bacterium]